MTRLVLMALAFVAVNTSYAIAEDGFGARFTDETPAGLAKDDAALLAEAKAMAEIMPAAGAEDSDAEAIATDLPAAQDADVTHAMPADPEALADEEYLAP